MEYDSASSCDERLRDLEARNEIPKKRQPPYIPKKHNSDPESPLPWRPIGDTKTQPKVAFNINKSLSKQVMEYYKKYSQNTNLDQYFSLPETSAENHGVKYYYNIYELNPRPSSSRQDCVGQDYNLGNYVPRERRRWARPPLIGQSSSAADNPAIYNRPLAEPRSPSPEAKLNTPETILEEKNESRENIGGDIPERKSNASPTSSVASHKPLEWDSGADVGYFNALPQNKQNDKKLSTIERMALAGGCSAALRQDPEGTTESNLSNKVLQPQGATKSKRKPDANSTPISGNISESESEIEITPIVKNHSPGILTADDDIVEQEKRAEVSEEREPVFKIPSIKYATEGKRASVLKKSSSMNILAPLSSKLLLKRSQSDLNLQGKDKGRFNLPLIFDSTSSLATVVNKPITCDKVIQTTINEQFQESIGIQVSVFEEEKPPVPKRGTSLAQKSIPSILKGSKNTYKLPDTREREDGVRPSSTDASCNESRPLTPRLDDTENVTGRANSFEYFPGHVYENVPIGSESHVSSVDTRQSNSTMPNTSSSIDEKLWGDSDSLVRDLERSVNILKSLVDANKCDKQVKKRLIHHVVKRLVTAKYTDDKIEHNLEENVPWNPDDARKKVYRTDIIQALTKKQNTTDSSEEWKPMKNKKSAASKKQINDQARIVDDMITIESSNSDKFDVQTDRTEMDGRKARMGLRADDCQRSTNSPTDVNKSESSECFLPHRRGDGKAKTRDNVFRYKRNPDHTSTSDTPVDRIRLYLNPGADNRQSSIESSNGTRNSTDWRLPTTLSERQFEMRRRSTSDSGDSKLVSYAETEKKNQLLWITNEISHLSNLKKLLEQSKKVDNPRISPKKAKHAILKQKPIGLLKCVCGSNNFQAPADAGRNASDVCEDSINQQWSSHCNLATCQSVDSSTKNMKKRNSCTQTGAENIRAHSQTGGEIVSTASKHRNVETESANIHVQTSPIPCEANLISNGEISSQAPCPVHKNYTTSIPQCLCHLSSKKSTRDTFSDVCHRRNLSPRSNPQGAVLPRVDQTNAVHRSMLQNKEYINQESDKENKRSEVKEAKNKVNATKSMCICSCNIKRNCKCVGNCFCDVNFISQGNSRSEKLSDRFCKLCSKRISQADIRGLNYKSQGEKLCNCDNYCDCENAKINEQKLCGCSARCKCENKKIDKLESDEKTCSCSKDRQCRCSDSSFCSKSEENKLRSKPYYLSNSPRLQPIVTQSSKLQSKGQCKCGKDCCCENKLRDIERRLYSPKRSARIDNCSCENGSSSGGDQHHCRSCGSNYQNGRKCNCRIIYPKPIAYELAFADNKSLKNSETFGNKNGKVDGKKYNDVSSSNSMNNNQKSGPCACEESKSYASSRSSGRTKTLQEYLAQNKPEFLNNVETRQQCMFEISHLRELRREKRSQLFAMASGSNLTKTPRATKPKAIPAQRKISDEEMKERLRKRYHKLHEVRNKRQQREKQEQARRNKLMANIFCKKLQQKVLKGQVDLSNSVSVISNL